MTELEVPTLFTCEPSQHLKCSVCQKLYKDPVINIVCGHTFCKACAFKITHCPTDGQHCDTNQMVVNRLVVGQIDDLEIHCRYGLSLEDGCLIRDPSGCQVKTQFGIRDSHESGCEFRPVPCPNSTNSCGKFRQLELTEHLEVCTFTPCSNHDKGCEFHGRKDEVTEHEKLCGYRGLQKKPSTDNYEQRTQQLEQENSNLKGHVSALQQRVDYLETTNSTFQTQLMEYKGSLVDIQQKYDSLSTSLEQLLLSRNRRSFGSSSNITDGRSKSSSFRKSLSGSPPNSVRYEKWAMPFQFKCIGTLRGHQDVVWCMATKNKKLYTAGSDSTIKVWDLENLARGCVKTIQAHSKEIQCMTIGGNLLYTGGHDNSINIWSLEDFSAVQSAQNAHDNIICTMLIAGDYLFSSSFSLIKVWEARSLVLKHTMQGLHHWVRSLTLNPERDLLYSGSHNTIDIWNVKEPFALKGKVDHQFGSVYSLAVTAKYIIAGTYNRNIHLFGKSSYEHVTSLKGHIGVVTVVVASPCGGYCFSGSSDKTIKVTDAQGTYNQNIQLFDAATYHHVQQLQMHIGVIYSLVATPSGRFLFSASVDKTIQIWNLENLLPTQTLHRHEGSVNALILHGDFLFSGSEDKEIKVFMYFQMQMGFAANA